MIGALAGMLAKKAAKTVAEKGSRKAAREAAEKALKKEDLLTKGAIGTGAASAAALGNEYGKSRAKDRDSQRQEKEAEDAARKKRYEMPADKYGKMIDEEMGESKGRMKGDYNEEPDMGSVKKRAGGMISSASKRADGCAQRGKTKGRMV